MKVPSDWNRSLEVARVSYSLPHHYIIHSYRILYFELFCIFLYFYILTRKYNFESFPKDAGS